MPHHNTVKVMLAGIGNAGTKAVQTAANQFPDATYAFTAIDTPADIGALNDKTPFDHVIAMDADWEDRLPEMLKTLEMLLVIVGLGGKTGPEGTKALETAAAAANVPVIIIATTPFSFEGEQRKIAAMKALAGLRQNANATIVLPNSILFDTLPQGTQALAAFEQADAWIAEVAISLLKPFTFTNIINIRKQNIEWLLNHKNATVSVGIGWGEGDDAITEAVQQLSASPFLKPLQPTAQADAALVMVSMPEDTTYSQLNGCLASIKGLFAANIKLEIGACQDDAIGEGIRIVTLMRYLNRPATRQAKTSQLPTLAETTATELHTDTDKDTTPDDKSEPDKKQLMLPMVEYSTGIFDKNNPTKYNFENLDIPTFLRRNIPILKES